jgi:GNAT superfamily N-acetyltransferase
VAIAAPPELAGLSIRRADSRDIAALVDSRIEFMRIVKDAGIEDEAGWREELSLRFSAGIATGDLVAWLCLDGESAVATGGIAFPSGGAGPTASELGLGPGEALVLSMHTLPAYRRRGIASELLRLCLGEARARGAARLRLRPTEMSRSLYEGAGFVALGGDMVLGLGLG